MYICKYSGQQKYVSIIYSLQYKEKARGIVYQYGDSCGLKSICRWKFRL